MMISFPFQYVRAAHWVLGLFLALNILPAAAQNPARLAAASSPVSREVAVLFSLGDYDAAIAQSTQLLERFQDPYLVYFRGYAAYNIGDYVSAQRDLSVLGDFTPVKGFPTAQQLIRRLNVLYALAPKNSKDIKVQGRVVFHVFFDEENPWSSAVMELLPRAYSINRELLGRDPAPASVWIFSDMERYKNFIMMLQEGKPLVSWQWACGGSNGLFFCQNVPNLSPQDTNSTYFRSSVVHEYNHCLMLRSTANVTIPPWFAEGLAMATAYYIDPKETEGFRRRLEKAQQANALLSCQQVNNLTFFQNTVEQQGARQNQADPYCQGWSMTQYFLSLVPAAQVTPFLEMVHQSGDFNKALFQFTGLTPQEFFDAWYANGF